MRHISWKFSYPFVQSKQNHSHKIDDIFFSLNNTKICDTKEKVTIRNRVSQFFFVRASLVSHVAFVLPLLYIPLPTVYGGRGILFSRCPSVCPSVFFLLVPREGCAS